MGFDETYGEEERLLFLAHLAQGRDGEIGDLAVLEGVIRHIGGLEGRSAGIEARRGRAVGGLLRGRHLLALAFPRGLAGIVRLDFILPLVELDVFGQGVAHGLGRG